MLKKLSICLLVLVLGGCAGNSKAVHTESVATPTSTAARMSVSRAVPTMDTMTVTETNSTERMISYSANVDLNVSDIDTAKSQIQDMVKGRGGYISDESNKRIVVYVPATGLDDFIGGLDDGVGTITDKTKTGKDVTDSYDDTTARLSTLYASRDQYMSLLKKATKVEDILKIEKELERVNTSIQKLEMQKKRTEQSVSMSRVSISLNETNRGLVGWIFYGIGKGLGWLF